MGNIQVALRIRPSPGDNVWILEGNTISNDSSTYSLDAVFDTDATNLWIYEKIVRRCVSGVLDGVNATVFAYGQTSSGKTYTMMGEESDRGIIPLSLSSIFECVDGNKDRLFKLQVSYLEIYNEVITDLLNPKNTNLKIHETIDRGIFVENLSRKDVGCIEDAERLMRSGGERRQVGKTNMNEHSSRSHAIFQLHVESVGKDGEMLTSYLSLIDLAGSERVGFTGAEKMRLKEGANINKSLLVLGTVISRLSEDVEGHIPFRDSKLTRILQPALSGNSQTLVICTINGSPKYYDETLSTIKFASRARVIMTHPAINRSVYTSPTARYTKLMKEYGEIQDSYLRLLVINEEIDQTLQYLRVKYEDLESLNSEMSEQLRDAMDEHEEHKTIMAIKDRRISELEAQNSLLEMQLSKEIEEENSRIGHRRLVLRYVDYLEAELNRLTGGEFSKKVEKTLAI